jgi:hypothetical protein
LSTNSKLAMPSARNGILMITLDSIIREGRPRWHLMCSLRDHQIQTRRRRLRCSFPGKNFCLCLVRVPAGSPRRAQR